MMVQPESDEALVSRLLPSRNASPEDRARAWAEWHSGGQAVLNYIRASNNTAEAHEDILLGLFPIECKAFRWRQPQRRRVGQRTPALPGNCIRGRCARRCKCQTKPYTRQEAALDPPGFA